MEHSETIVAITKALIAFKGKVQTVAKDAKNPHFNRTYASLMAIIEATQGPLTECRLVLMQHPVGTDQLTTILLHESGEYFKSTMLMSQDRGGPQAQGSAITYAKRYAMTAILGLASDDDDGNAATNQSPTKQPTPKAKPAMSEQHFEKVVARIMLGNMDEAREMCKGFSMTEAQKKGMGDAAADRKTMDEMDGGN